MISTFSDPAESSLTPSSATATEALSIAPHTASGSETVTRIVRVPLERPDDAEWRLLVALAREGAAFANGTLSGWWAEAHGWCPQEGQSTFKDFKGRLSGDVRVAIQSEAFGVWRRHKARVLRREQRLPAFALDRALVVRGQYARGLGGVRLTPWRDGFRLRLRLIAAADGPPMEFAVWPLALQKDRYLSGLLTAIASGAYRCSKVTLQIDQRRRKLYAMCAYERPIPAARTRSHSATLGPLEEDGSLLLRSASETRDWTHEVYIIRAKKPHYEGLIRRLRRQTGRGPQWRQRYRQQLPPTYEQWATGKIHQLSAAMVAWCAQRGIGLLRVRPLGDGDWPAHQLESFLTYKAQHVGIAVERCEPEADVTPGGIRAEASPLKKAQRTTKRIKQLVRLVTDDLQPTKG